MFFYLIYSDTEEYVRFLKKAGPKTGWTHLSTFACGQKATTTKKKDKKGKDKKGKEEEEKEDTKSAFVQEFDPTVLREAVTFVSVFGYGDVCIRPCDAFSITYQQYAKHSSFLLSKTPPNTANLILHPFHPHLHPTIGSQRVSLLICLYCFLSLTNVVLIRIKIGRIWFSFPLQTRSTWRRTSFITS